MKVEDPTTVEDEPVPSLFARYRFYTRARVPTGYNDWAVRQLKSGRWMVVHLLLEGLWLSILAALMFRYAGNTSTAWIFVAAVLVTTPLFALHYRKRALREASLLPRSRDVLRQIDEAPPG